MTRSNKIHSKNQEVTKIDQIITKLYKNFEIKKEKNCERKQKEQKQKTSHIENICLEKKTKHKNMKNSLESISKQHQKMLGQYRRIVLMFLDSEDYQSGS